MTTRKHGPEPIGKLVGEVLSTLKTPTRKQPVTTDGPSWDWQWKLTGTETPAEVHDLSAMVMSAQAFITEITAGGEPRWLSLIGKSGAGKTYPRASDSGVARIIRATVL